MLESLSKAAAAPAVPFALHDQYVPNLLAARGEAPAEEHEDDDGDECKDDGDKRAPPVKPKKSKGKAKATSKPKKRKADSESGWNYASIRNTFITSRRFEGETFENAQKLWDASEEKTRYLAPCSVGELKKRKFLPKGSTSNPWHEKLHGPAK